MSAADVRQVSPRSLLDHAKAAPALAVRDAARFVARTTGKSVFAQRREIVQLRMSIGMLTADEYYYYRLYDDRAFTGVEKRRFLGLDAQHRILRTCTDQTWWAVVHDKLVFQALFQAHGASMPRITAIYHPSRVYPGATPLRTRAELGAFLRDHVRYPMFGKPFDGMYSVGSARFEAYERATDRVRLHAGIASVEDLLGELTRYAQRGYLFQEVKHPHPALEAICGDRLGCLRVVVLLGPDGAEVFRALWKIPVGGHVADNFWRPGNMLAAIDTPTGRITRVVTGVGPDQREVERHPDTGATIVGAVVPHWSEVRRLCSANAAVLPGVRMQAWDIGVCAEGPVVIEANVGGDFNLPQLAAGAGMLDDRFARFLRERRYAPRPAPVQAAYALAPRGVREVAWRLLRVHA